MKKRNVKNNSWFVVLFPLLLLVFSCRNFFRIDEDKDSVGEEQRQLAPPLISIVEGSYDTDQEIILTAATPGAAIHYTLDASVPTSASSLYTEPIKIVGDGSDITISAIVCKSGMKDSAVSRSRIVIDYHRVSTPLFSQEGGEFTSGLSIAISCPTAGAVIRYTLDGSAPTAESPLYCAPIPIDGDGTVMTLSAIATNGVLDDSHVKSAVFRIKYPPTEMVQFDPPPDGYTSNLSVSLSSPSAGAEIYYTLDGSDPVPAASTRYTTAIAVSGDVVIKAIAIAPKCSLSSTSSGHYFLYSVPLQTLAAAEDSAILIGANKTAYVFGKDIAGVCGHGLASVSSPVAIMGDVRSVATGGSHFAMITEDGSLWMAGHNSNGRLGDNTTRSSEKPIKVMSGARSVATGHGFTLVNKADDSVWAFGDNSCGCLGDGTTIDRHAPQLMMKGIKAVAAGFNHSVLLGIDGSVWTCGDNFSGELGTGDTIDRTTPVKVMDGAVSIAAGAWFTLVVKSDGTLVGFGDNQSSQVGNLAYRVLQPYAFASSIRSASGGYWHTLALKDDGVLWGIGSNFYWQLGPGTQSEGTWRCLQSGVSAMAAGREFTIFQLMDGSFWGIGDNREGQLGSGALLSRSTFTKIMDGAIWIEAGPDDSFIIRADGTTFSFGRNDSGEHGYEPDTFSPLEHSYPKKRSDPRFASVWTSGSGTFFLTFDNELYACGGNSSGQLGTGSESSFCRMTKIGNDVAMAKAGLILKKDGTLWACGGNEYGQVGDGTKQKRLTPVQVMSDVTRVWRGGSASFAIRADGSLWGWGGNFLGQLGLGDKINRLTPVKLMDDTVDIASGGYTFFVIKSDNTLWWWGKATNAYYGIAPGEYQQRPAKLMDDVKKVTGYGSFVMALKKDGSLWALGNNLMGCFGDGSSADAPAPRLVFSEVADVASGNAHVLVLKLDGSVWSAGDDRQGQLGVSRHLWEYNPVPITLP